MKWNNYPKTHPEIGKEVLIFCQGYDITGKVYWSHYELAIYDKNVWDKRRMAFYQTISYKHDTRDGGKPFHAWIYNDVTHWAELLEAPEKVLPKRERISFTVNPKGCEKQKRASFLVRR